MLSLFRRPTLSDHARSLGRLGGRARAEQMRAGIREKTRELRVELGLPVHGGLA